MTKLSNIPTGEYYSAIQRNEPLKYIWKDLKRITLNEKKKAFSEVFILYGSIYITFWKRQHYRNGELIRGFQGPEKGRRRKVAMKLKG